MVKGLLGKKERLHKLWINPLLVWINACSTNAPLRTSLTAYLCKDCVLQVFWVFCAIKAQKEVRKLSLAYCALRRRLGKEKERVLSVAAYFLSIYWLRV